ncbi:hypothetical protein [Escherichia coli]|uniref:hypothetical protein n=1 Tax=Escherichia coli TaxID=562 RepID=UPI001FCE7A57|nr:hypothetical protein [Escherichia coli]
MNEREFFFTKIIWAMDYTHMKSLRLAAEDFPLALATAKILPWPWGESSYRSALADIAALRAIRGYRILTTALLCEFLKFYS